MINALLLLGYIPYVKSQVLENYNICYLIKYFNYVCVKRVL